MSRLLPIAALSLLLLCTSSRAAAPDPALARALAPLHETYDPAERMLKRPFSSPGYHTALTGGMVHSTRESIRYGVACLATGDPQLVARGCDVLRRVIALQDKDPKSRTYGIWSWFLEEPLDKMSPPDWNWADFNGRELLQAVLRHPDKLPPDLRKEIDATILHAARSVQRRNVGPGYTNIAVLGTYVTLVTAETYNLPDLKAYATERLRNLHAYTKRTGGFTEYNSPTYTVVTLTGLGGLVHDVKDPESKRLAGELYHLAWEEMATHFHAPTRQWAGPHSRCYSTLLRPNVLALIQAGTSGRVDLGQADAPANLESLDVPLPCPPKFEPMFKSLDAPRSVLRTFVQSGNPVAGTTYLHPAFCLGTINRGDTWNQRRNLVAYWGTADKPAYLHLRLLKNGYDFAAGQFAAAQRDGDALAAIAFATDGGDTHVSLKKIRDGQFTAKDLRVRLEFGGSAAGAKLTAPAKLADPATADFGSVKLRAAVPHAAFADLAPHWEAGPAENAVRQGNRPDPIARLDIVLYAGPERAFDLKQMEQAVIGLALGLSPDMPAAAPATAKVDAARLQMEWNGLKVEIPARPDKAGALQKAIKTTAGR